MTQIISHLSEIGDSYDATFVDLWGCLHNGVTAFPDAVAALQDYRRKGGIVVLLTNAPRQRSEVRKQLKKFNVPDDCWDTITTSGDSARLAMFTGAVGNKVYFIGQPHDQPFFDPLKLVEDPVEIRQVPLEEAEGIVCCGPFDPYADPDEMRGPLLYAKQKGLKLLCANPDIVVDRGERREWCAGKLAQMYEEMGGQSLYFGKPHPPIYDLARRRLGAVKQGIPDSRILCIGDGILTDVRGAIGEDLDCLFITGGLAREETGTDEQPDPEKLDAFLAAEQMSPRYAIGMLR
ncbi:TIGR01459 family HAD-type hydrolase [Pseudaestuariivita atlantica]|uniref:HAD family hydrolase n=1 Tax=Pseudaestuariivita atlantica TaxID=1317121 RepID=A0A0L1JTG7_9RHOB|nr:TIGR01459 family HAD-type hydrolase [Pseudaestuariivita atlantica]KNG95040.1 HAD family hydrolase [Pseudaestuariivita atlantica]